MKKFISIFILFTTFIVVNAQTTISISGNTVTFNTKFPANGFSSTPVYLYTWINTTDNTQTLFTNPTGAWPGTLMTGPDGSGNYTYSINLASFYNAGTTINNMNFIYNNNAGTQTSDQTASAGATGWSAVTIATLGLSDLTKLQTKSVVSAGKLYTNKKGNLTISVYDMNGRLLQSSIMKATENPIDLQVNQTGNYIVSIANGSELEVLKFKK